MLRSAPMLKLPTPMLPFELVRARLALMRATGDLAGWIGVPR
jgi:hypothetical protein